MPDRGDERGRLEALERYGVLDSAEETDFTDVAELAAQICGTPISLVTLVDENRQWFKAEKGLGRKETPRDLSFCSYAIEREEMMVVPDASADPRFRDNELVTSDPNIRFYAGAPLVTPDGYRLGTLCVIDDKPRELNEDQLRALEALARQVSALLELRRYKAEVEIRLHGAEKPEDGLRHAWDSVRDLTRKIREVFFLADPSSGRISYISPSFDLLWGRPREDFVGGDFDKLADALHPDDRGLAKPAANERVEYRIVTVEGEIRWVSQEAFVVSMSGSEERVAIIARDVTESVLARVALVESEERFRLLVDSVQEYAIYMLSPHGIVSSWNTGAQRIKGYEPDEIIGRHFSTFYTEKDRAAGVPEQALRTALRDGRYAAEGWRVRKTGDPFWASVVISPLTGDRGELRGFAKVTRDLTERRAAEEERLRIQRSALNAQKLEVVGRLAGGIAHDFNNLLAVVAGAASLIAERADDVESVREEAGEILSAAQRGAKLVGQLVTIGRPSSGTPAEVNLNELVRSAESLLTRAVGTDVSISTALAEDPPLISVDRTHVEQILLNLAVNARDAMPGGGDLEIATDAITGEDDQRFVRLIVTDTGEGIDPEVVGRIFEPFFTTKGEGGSGLGLSTVASLVEASGGDIRVTSTAGKGSTFEVLFPATDHLDAAESQPPAGLRGLTILLVEDEDPLRRIIRKALMQEGAEVFDERSPNEALEAVRAGLRPDLLIADVVMPERKGPDLAREVLAIRPEVSVLFISGYAQAELERRAVEIGSFLPKPFTPADLVEAARNAYIPVPGSPSSRTR